MIMDLSLGATVDVIQAIARPSLIGGVTVAASILWTELVRDSYHLLAHLWPPLGKLHTWHHRVFRPDLTAVTPEIYRQAHWYNDIPEALVMLVLSAIPVVLLLVYPWAPWWIALAGSAYTLFFLTAAIARGLGWAGADELTDLTHRPGPFQEVPGHWFVNRTYHWRHHFDDQNAYFCGTVTLLDRLLGKSLALKGKRIAVTGASGTLGTALLHELTRQGAKVLPLSSHGQPILVQGEAIAPVVWQVGNEADLKTTLEKVDILILNHGANAHGDRSAAAIAQAYEVNAFSQWRLLEVFLETIQDNRAKATKEVWVNTSEAEVNPAFSPLYELSKRTIGDLITLRRLDSPCVIRKLILGPFRSNLNPIGVMDAHWVARLILFWAKRDGRNIIVTINPLTFLLFPLKEIAVSTYFRLFTRRSVTKG